MSDELSGAAHESLQSRQKAYGFQRGSARPAGAYDSKYLLTGMVECGVCGGTIEQTWNGQKPAYRRWYNHSRGRAVCANAVVVDMNLADETVLRAITRDVLDPEVVGEALELALRELEQPAADAARRDTQGRAHAAGGRAQSLRGGDRGCRTARHHPAGGQGS